MKTVLILDANQRSALAVTRSLGRQGILLITADETTTALAGSSHFSSEYIIYPSPRLYTENFLTSIARVCKTKNIHIIFPMTELTTNMLLENQNLLPDVILPFPNISSVNALADKHLLMQLADSLNIPIPRTLHVDPAEGSLVEFDQLNYPLVLKPSKSWLPHEDEWLHTSVRFAETPAETVDILKQDPAFLAHPFMLQDYVPGKGEGLFALYDHGKAMAFFAHRRLREKPPQGGVSVLSESAPLDPKLLDYTRSLLDHANWHGIAMVEFRVEKDGTPYLMEVNTRFWGSLQLSVDSGVDFPWLLYQVACGEQILPVKSYKMEMRLRWILGDIDSLYLTLRDSNLPWMSKVKATLNFLLPRPFKTKHEVNRLSDFAPFWWELKQYVRELLKKS